MKDVLIKKRIISDSEDLFDWLKDQFIKQYGEEPKLNEQSINANQKLVLFLLQRYPGIERMVKYLRRRGLDIYYMVYDLYEDGDTIYLVTNEIVGKPSIPSKKLQAKETISVEEYIEIFQKHGLNNTAEIVKQLYEGGRAYSRKHLMLNNIAEGKIKIEFSNPDESPEMYLWVQALGIVDRLVEISEEPGIPLKKDRLELGCTPISFTGMNGLRKFDGLVKQFIHRLEVDSLETTKHTYSTSPCECRS